MTNNDKSAATWSDVKDKLGDFDRAGLLGLVQDLYTSEFSARPFRLGSDVLEPYKTIIGRWLRPDLHRHQEYSVAKAKRPIADYKKAAGRSALAKKSGWTTAPITTLWPSGASGRRSRAAVSLATRRHTRDIQPCTIELTSFWLSKDRAGG